MPEITTIEVDVGRQGPEGASAAVLFTWDTGTTDADPGAGKLRVNNAALASATAIYVDNVNAAGGSITGWLDSFDDVGASTGRGLLMLQKKGAAENLAIYRITGSVVDGTGYRKLTATYAGGAGSFSAGDVIAALFVPAGETGATGEAPETEVDFVGATSATLQASDHLKIKVFTSDDPVTVTVPSGLAHPFACGIRQKGAGKVTLSFSGPVTVDEPDDLYETGKQGAFIALESESADTYFLVGRTYA